MHRALSIARREYVAAVTTKAFLLGLLLTPLLMGSGFLIIAVTQQQSRSTERRIAVIDRSGLLGDALVEAARARKQGVLGRGGLGPDLGGGNYVVEVVTPSPASVETQALALSDEVRAGRLHAFVEIGAGVIDRPGGGDGRIRYHGRSPALDEVRGWLAGVINDRLRRERLIRAGVDPALVTNLFAWVPLEGMSLVGRDVRTGAIQRAERQSEAMAVAVPMVVAMMAMLLLMTGAMPLLQSVMEEKTQRVAEVMLGAATPWEIMLGKLLGGVGVSLTAMGLYVLTTLATLSSLAMTHAVPAGIVLWFVAYVVLGVLMFGAVAAALGSACGDAKDAQHLQLPVILPMMLPMFLFAPVIQDPQSPIATVLSLFPPFTPILMLMRLSASGEVPAWQPWVGMLGVGMLAAVNVWVGGRIFRVGLLMQGKMPRLREVIRWGWRG